MATKKRKFTSNKRTKTGKGPVRKNVTNTTTPVNGSNFVEETSIPPVEIPSSPRVTNTATPMGMSSLPSIFNPVNISFLIAAVISLAVGGIALFGNPDFKTNDRFLWGVFTLISAALSCFISAIITLATQHSEDGKENKMLQRIEGLLTNMTNKVTHSLTENIDEITTNVNLIHDILYSEFNLKLVVSNKQDDLVKKLMDQSLRNRGIKSIRILAHTSDSFYNYFMKYFKNKENERKFECTVLKVLIHSQYENKQVEVGNNWRTFYTSKKIHTVEVRRTNKLERRSFFGMIIDFDKHQHHRIGMLGFYEPKQSRNAENSVIDPLKMKYGVVSEDSSLLDVLDKNFEHYFNDDAYSESVVKETKQDTTP